MELIYTCEKSEKETLELAMRPFKRYFRTVFAMAAVMFVLAVECFLPELIAEGVVPKSGMDPGGLLLLISLTIVWTGWFRRRRFRRCIMDTYRKRKTNLAEYRLSDESFYAAQGETKATMPWSEFAKYRIDPDALYLQCNNGSVVCVPDWGGRGVDESELAATLEKAGLKQMNVTRARRLANAVLWVTFAIIVFGVVITIHRTWETLREHIVNIELKRQLYELVWGDGSEDGNPYSYSRYWKERGNFVQRFAVSHCKFGFGERWYIFNEEAEYDKVGLAATEGDDVWCVYLPLGAVVQCTPEEFETIKEGGTFGDFYPESQRGKWLERVRQHAQELREDMDDDQ
ncbi:MAG: YcxB family protein [Thermoguttaceae bacterium]|nr:YcxB family protein [Thermoguttaceae bacterium]